MTESTESRSTETVTYELDVAVIDLARKCWELGYRTATEESYPELGESSKQAIDHVRFMADLAESLESR